MLTRFRKSRKHAARRQRVDQAVADYNKMRDAFEEALNEPFNPLEYFFDTVESKRRKSRPVIIPAPSLTQVARGFGALFAAVIAPARILRYLRRVSPAVAQSGIRPHNFGSAARRILQSGIVLAGGAVAAGAAVVAVATQMPTARADAAAVIDNRACAEAHVLIDGEGYAGAQPVGSCSSDIAQTAAFYDDTAMIIATYFSVIEGGVFVEDTLFGQDLWGITRWALSRVPYAQTISEAIGLPFTQGGSSGFLTATEAFHGSPNALSVLEKPRMIVASVRLAASEYRTNLSRAHLVSALPVIAGYGGTPLGGIHGAQILFGGAPKEHWQLCVFASALGKPFLLGTGATLHDFQTERNKRTLVRARDCLHKIVADRAELSQQLQALDSWRPPPVPEAGALDPALRRTLRQDLRLAGKTSAAEVITLTTSRKAQAHLIEAGNIATGSGVFAGIRRALPADACMVPDACDQPVGFAFAAAEIVGDRFLPRAVRSNVSGALYGPVKAGENGYHRIQPAMGQGSIGKLAHLIVAADNRVQSLCSKSWGRIRDFDGFAGVDDCAKAFGSPQRRSVAEAISWSANLGFLHLATQYENDMRALFRHLGWMGDYSAEATIGAALGLGMQPTPADVMQTLGAIEVGRLHPLSTVGGERAEGNGSLVDLAAYGLDEAERARVQYWVSQPVLHGTLTATVRAMSLPGGCIAKSGKSGTTYDTPRRLSKNLVLSVICGNRTFVLYAGVWTLDQSRGDLGDLTHVNLAPMLSATLAAAMKS
jgi:hypothetical protein